MRAMNEKIMMDVEGKFWTRQNELVEELESMGYEVVEISADHVVVVDLYDEDELEYTLHISRANRMMWIDSVD